MFRKSGFKFAMQSDFMLVLFDLIRYPMLVSNIFYLIADNFFKCIINLIIKFLEIITRNK